MMMLRFLYNEKLTHFLYRVEYHATGNLQEEIERKNIAKFSHIWNEFINSLREEDLIDNECVFPSSQIY
jgi:hypothetical protein